MTTKEDEKSFGEQLAFYRRQCNNPQKGGSLTQSALSDQLHLFDNSLLYTKVQISHWETEKRSIPFENRVLLQGLIYVFIKFGGVKSKNEADQFLLSGLYAPLSPTEIKSIINQAEALNSDINLFNQILKASNQAEDNSLSTMPGVIKELYKHIDDNRKLTATLLKMENQRLIAIANLSNTQRAILEIIPHTPIELDQLFNDMRIKIPKLSNVRIKELNLRLHELRYLGLIDRRKNEVNQWLYWREEPRSLIS